MRRELNPAIFGQTPTPELGRSISTFEANEAPGLILSNEVKDQLQSLRTEIMEIEKESAQEILRNAHQVQAFADQFTQLFESLSDRMAALEADSKAHSDEQNEQNQLNEKIEALLERHNEIVRNFENKLTHLTRILSEQESQILNSKAALEDAHREISRQRS